MDFINLKQGTINVWKYALEFTKLSKYNPSLIPNPRECMNKFISSVSNFLKMESKRALFVREIDNSRLMTHTEQTESDKY